MKLSYLIKGLPGHPLHPPFTDATIGIYTGATAFGVLSALGVSEVNMAKTWWLALVVRAFARKNPLGSDTKALRKGHAATSPRKASGFRSS